MVSRALAQRNATIRTEIMKLMAYKSPEGHQKYTSAYIFDHVAAQYDDLKPRTIKNIFWENGAYCMNSRPPQNVVSPI